MSWILYILIGLFLLTCYRLVRGPFLEDRILALNVIAVIIVLVMCYYSLIYEQSFYLDIALIYTLLSFSEVLAFIKFGDRVFKGKDKRR